MLPKALSRTTSVSAPLSLHGVDRRRREVFERDECADPRNPPPPVQLDMVEVPRTGHGDVRTSKAGNGDAGRRRRERAVPWPSDARPRRFSEPGEYVLHIIANDYSGDGGGGEVCCWTTALMKVTVTP